MNFKGLSSREKILAAIVVLVFVGGGYGLLRAKPMLKAIADTKTATQAGEEKLRKTIIPEEPTESPAKLQKDQLAVEAELAARKQEASQLETRLAPPDSQELRLRISELAADYNLRIRINQAYAQNKVAKAGAAATTVYPQTRRGVRQAARDSRRAAAAQVAAQTSAAGAAQPGSLAPASGMHGLMFDMANGSDFQRPLQELGLEGTFDNTQQFLEGLQGLPWQVTAVQVQMVALTPKEGSRGQQQVSTTLIMQY